MKNLEQGNNPGILKLSTHKDPTAVHLMLKEEMCSPGVRLPTSGALSMNYSNNKIQLSQNVP